MSQLQTSGVPGIDFTDTDNYCDSLLYDIVPVTLRDGIEITLASGDVVIADSNSPDGEFNFVSHAHGDHLYRNPPETMLCSELTAALADSRREEQTPERNELPDNIELLNAGHIPGSQAIHVTDQTGREYLYTGDVCTRDRFYLSGFEPVSADVLIIEATYGKPLYEFPPHDEVVAAAKSWITDRVADQPVVLLGYSLGRAQELCRIAAQTSYDRLFVSEAIAELNSIIENHMNVKIPGERYRDDTEFSSGDILILPSQLNRSEFLDRLVSETNAVTAGFSGWAIDDSYRYRLGVDTAFPISDHCDFTELLDISRRVDPELIYTQHGFVDELATHIRSEVGVEAQALKKNQSTLGDFSNG